MKKLVVWLVPLSIIWYVARFHSDWFYPMSGVSMQDDPDRLVAFFVITLGCVIAYLLILAVLWLVHRTLKHRDSI